MFIPFADLFRHSLNVDSKYHCVSAPNVDIDGIVFIALSLLASLPSAHISPSIEQMPF